MATRKATQSVARWSQAVTDMRDGAPPLDSDIIEIPLRKIANVNGRWITHPAGTYRAIRTRRPAKNDGNRIPKGMSRADLGGKALDSFFDGEEPAASMPASLVYEALEAWANEARPNGYEASRAAILVAMALIVRAGCGEGVETYHVEAAYDHELAVSA